MYIITLRDGKVQKKKRKERENNVTPSRLDTNGGSRDIITIIDGKVTKEVCRL